MINSARADAEGELIIGYLNKKAEKSAAPLFFPGFPAEFNGAGGADIGALSAAYAFSAVGIFDRINSHRAKLCAFAAGNTFLRVELLTVERKAVKKSVKRTQWAQIPTEWAADHHGKNNDYNKGRELPCEYPA